jgi:hypothetical protein
VENAGRLAGVRIERICGQPVGSGRAADAEVDASRGDAFEYAELLGHLQRGIMRQHDAGAAHAYA